MCREAEIAVACLLMAASDLLCRKTPNSSDFDVSAETWLSKNNELDVDKSSGLTEIQAWTSFSTQ